MAVLRARKRPVEITAMLFDGTPESAKAVIEWIDGMTATEYMDDGTLGIATLEDSKTIDGASHFASEGDYVIRGIKGEFYPCKPDVFLATYDILMKTCPPNCLHGVEGKLCMNEFGGPCPTDCVCPPFPGCVKAVKP